MGRYRARRVIIRELMDITVVFWDRSSIYVYPKGTRHGYVFHKWYSPLGTYTQQWKPFKRKMLKTKRLTLTKCFQLANQHEILYKYSVGTLDLEKKPIEIRFLNWKISGMVRKE